MSSHFAELDWRQTPLGAISLRRRHEPTSGADIYEVKLDDSFLMSSMFTQGEAELARMALGAISGRPHLDVVVGGLGLGYTAQAVLADPRVRELVVVEALAEVIDWHTRGLVPLGPELTADPRCTMVHGDFFAMAAGTTGLDGQSLARRFDLIAVDIDHSPRHVLNPGNAGFYTTSGLLRLSGHLREGGVFSLWSNDPPDAEFLTTLCSAFPDGAAHVVHFDNPLQGGQATNTVYVGTAPDR